MDALRFTDGPDETEQTNIEGLLCPYGGNFNGRDSYGTFFSAETDFCLDWFAPDARPLTWSHGLDKDAGVTPVGRMTNIEVRSDGVWIQGQLDARNKYYEDIKKMVGAGALGLSSGSVQHLVEIDSKTGEIKKWPIIEGALTPTPSNLLAYVDFTAAKSHYRTAGIEVADATLALLDDTATEGVPPGYGVNANAYRHPTVFDDLVINGDPATRDADDGDGDGEVGTDERSFEDICGDLDRLLNPLYSGAYTERLDTFPTHVLVKRYEYGGDGYAPINDPDDGCTYWDIPYTIGPDREPVLGVPVQVERNESYTPVARAADIPLGFDAQLVQRHVSAFAASTEGYGERRFREGRMLSASNLQTISDAADGLEAHAKKLRDLHAKASARQDEAARAARFADPEWVRVQLKLLELAAV